MTIWERASCVCEHRFHEATISLDRLPAGMVLYRGPLACLPVGDCRERFPHAVSWDDLRAGDLVLAVATAECGGLDVIERLDVWHVVKADHDAGLLRVRFNTLVEMWSGDETRDRLAGLVGVN